MELRVQQIRRGVLGRAAPFLKPRLRHLMETKADKRPMLRASALLRTERCLYNLPPQCPSLKYRAGSSYALITHGADADPHEDQIDRREKPVQPTVIASVEAHVRSSAFLRQQLVERPSRQVSRFGRSRMPCGTIRRRRVVTSCLP